MKDYIANITLLEQDLKVLKSKLNLIAFLRLVIFLGLAILLIYYQNFNTTVLVFLCTLAVVLFLILVRLNETLIRIKRLTQNKLKINQAEIDFLEKGFNYFDDGKEFIDTSHAYSYDLDIFGQGSLFQHLNRTHTYIGKKSLAKHLLKDQNIKEIRQTQDAVKELMPDLSWRQNFSSLAMMIEKEESNYKALNHWVNTPVTPYSKVLKIALIIMPILFLTSVIAMIWDMQFKSLSILIFSANLILFTLNFKRINQEISTFDRISNLLEEYAFLIQEIEQKKFESTKLNLLKQRLNGTDNAASKKIKKLANIFSNLENSHNLLGAIIFNGTCLYHLHILNQLHTWKTRHAKEIACWLEVIAEIETLNSLANFAFNNPEYTYPTLNQNKEISFYQMGHPLIPATERINNHISFNKHSFIILTGSNMSGKSTFLRSLGINMILTQIGSVACTTKANVHPHKVLVSMRQTDSLNKGESFFFAEISRLKKLIDTLAIEPHLILLDEILKGTNSEDKRYGTKKVIEKIIKYKPLGCLATHDIEITKLTDKYPDIITNKYFESKIKDGELIFDYRLKNGVCTSRNATELMRQIGIL